MNNPPFTFFWGILVPGLVMLVAILLTIWLYRSFSKD